MLASTLRKHQLFFHENFEQPVAQVYWSFRILHQSCYVCKKDTIVSSGV